MAGYRFMLRSFLCCFFVVFLIMIFVGYQVLSNADWSNPAYEVDLDDLPPDLRDDDPKTNRKDKPVTEEVPVLLWWTPFTKEKGKTKTCGNVKCFVTEQRKYLNISQPMSILFYGTDMTQHDLPLPRLAHHEWALLHEESPQNSYMLSHADVLTLFNHTSTFRRESDYPITTQYLKSIADLESTIYLKSVSEKNRLRKKLNISLVNYVQSDCGALSDRDHLVRMLQRHLDVDCYGKCNHNRDLPQHLRDPLRTMDHKDFYEHLSHYKFTIAFENGVCKDYITEKFWRPFLVGSVPIIFGSPSAKDFIPSNHSAIFVEDYKDIAEIANIIKYLDENDDEYQKYLQFKKTGVTNEILKTIMAKREWSVDGDWTTIHYIEAFECFICKRLHENLERSLRNEEPVVHQASVEHYGCPQPKKFSDNPPGNLERINTGEWGAAWLTGKYIAMAIKAAVAKGIQPYSEEEFMDKVLDLYRLHEIKQEL